MSRYCQALVSAIECVTFSLEVVMIKKRHILLILVILSGTFLTESKIHANIPNPYEIWQQRNIKIGLASWYSKQDPGIRKHTANMEIFDDTGLTAAMWDIPFNQKIKVTNLENGLSVIVRVNDRGPHRRLVQQGRIIDLSKQAFLNIASLDKGLIDIQLVFLQF